MFHLTDDELDNAFGAVDHHGYSIYLPTPPEWEVVRENWTEFRGHLGGIDLDQYQPCPPMRLYAPKSRINIRPVTLLHPFDMLIYSALVLIAKGDIEAGRVRESEQRVFSNRAAAERNRLYKAGRYYSRYRRRLKAKAREPGRRVVAVTDIADFFPRIYQHRLENVIKAVASTDRVGDVARVLVKKLIGYLERTNSYGIPVGPHASSLLAEAILIDVDSALLNAGFDFLRWFDDYHFFCTDEQEAQRALFFLGEWLHTHHGLTLQPAKTKILPRASFQRGLQQDLEHRLEKRAKPLVALWSKVQTAYGEEPRSLSKSELAEIEATNLKGALVDAFQKGGQSDYELAQFILGKIASSESLPTDKKLELVDVVLDNVAECYPIAGTLARFFATIGDIPASKRRSIIQALLQPILDEHNPPPPYYSMWILNMIAEQPAWNHADLVRSIYSKSRSEVVRRYSCLALAKTGNRTHVLQTTTDLNGASPLLRTAILMAWHRLGADERKHLKRASVVSDPLEKSV